MEKSKPDTNEKEWKTTKKYSLTSHSLASPVSFNSTRVLASPLHILIILSFSLCYHDSVHGNKYNKMVWEVWNTSSDFFDKINLMVEKLESKEGYVLLSKKINSLHKHWNINNYR